jgi:hypothetical protein
VHEYGDLTRTTTDGASETLRDEAGLSSEGQGEDWLWTVCANVVCAASDLVPRQGSVGTGNYKSLCTTPTHITITRQLFRKELVLLQMPRILYRTIVLLTGPSEESRNPYLGINRAWTLLCIVCSLILPVNQRERGRHMFGRIIRFQKISSRFYSTNARTQMEDPRPPWVYVMSRLLSFTVIPSMHRLSIQQSFIVDEFQCSRNSIFSVLS